MPPSFFFLFFSFCCEPLKKQRKLLNRKLVTGDLLHGKVIWGTIWSISLGKTVDGIYLNILKYSSDLMS